ncbi:MAG: FG-GAP-like repeat-containing protein [Thainema sp.]
MSNVYLFAQNAVQLEGDSGTTPFTFQVVRTGDTTNELTVDYTVNSPVLTAVVDGELPADESDFGGTFPSGTVTFAAGEAVQTITVEVAGDEIPEVEQPGLQNADLFNVTLSNASSSEAIIATEQQTGIILNDDMANVFFSSDAQTTISDTAFGASSILAADIDGDGDADALSSSPTNNTITWYENANGDGTTWTANVITNTAVNPETVFTSDIDGDGDADVLSASTTTGEISWYENQDGTGTFSEANLLSTGITGATSIISADVDGDTDADLLVAGNNSLIWYENQGLASGVTDPDMGGDGDGGVIGGDNGGDIGGDIIGGQDPNQPVVGGDIDIITNPDVGGDIGGDIIGGQDPTQPSVDLDPDIVPTTPTTPVPDVDLGSTGGFNGNGTGDQLTDPILGQPSVGQAGDLTPSMADAGMQLVA